MEQTESCISVYDGEYFDLLEPDRSVYTINTIAHALSNLCRYTGHVNRFYSVAEHSVFVSLAVPKKFALEALFHDASEAFLGDVSSPLKKLLPEYKVSKGCLHCGYSLSPYALDFDHLDPTIKKFDVSRRLCNGTLTSLFKEIRKCQVLCANCHRIKTYEDKCFDI